MLSGFGSMSVYVGSVPEHHTKLRGMGFIRLLPFHLSFILIASLPFTNYQQHLSLLDVR
jgi:Ni,Fe-hydrogenase I cytochrome b subunit